MTFILAVAVDLTADLDPAQGGPARLRAVRALEAAGADFVTLGEGPGAADSTLGALDVLAKIAPITANIGLVPTVTVARREPVLVSTATATLDYASRGRSGWQAAVDGGDPAGEWERAEALIDVVRELWDAWEDRAVRDEVAERYIDRDRLRYENFLPAEGARGAGAMPRPPQGNPPVVIGVSDTASLDTAARTADVVVLADGAGLTTTDVRSRIVAHGRGALPVRILLSVPYPYPGGDALIARVHTELRDGPLDGLHLRPLSLAGDARGIAHDLIPRLRAEGILGAAGLGSLRRRLGLGAALRPSA
ncbi:LLM class flavin-dependent oxidoreductase [Mycetocola spongiae]|uniref:LLM class flavin-dependent oxidoreductase n=1 Tax=Mycetocola spongiae TaxID=2859226 RepID=UPI001CF4DBC4|nr:LLM class flavin-dependent oxidoreductase [Mycetocola spongiae]UCR88844.1 LLM class flavin-dependent oxidoreductase [Mycetocola spongiae]